MEESEWQHLNTCHVATFIHARLPRIKCKKHGVKCSLQGVFRLPRGTNTRHWSVI